MNLSNHTCGNGSCGCHFEGKIIDGKMPYTCKCDWQEIPYQSSGFPPDRWKQHKFRVATIIEKIWGRYGSKDR